MVQPLEAYEGSALKGGQYPLGYIQPTTLSTNVLSTIMGHIPQPSLYVQLGSHPHLRLCPHHLLPGGLSVDVVSMRGWAIG